MRLFGAIEAGGTKFVCGIGTGPENLTIVQIPTTTPKATVRQVIDFFQGSKEPIRGIGIGSFGPIDLHPESPTFGFITSTPKPGWRDFNIAGIIAGKLGVPVGFDTDVNAAALGEGRWGAAVGLTDFLYLTVGTGIGGGAVVNDSLLHGLMHPEMGHLRIPHDRSRDPFTGNCPFHGDCLEGLASGPAMQARWGVSPSQLPEHHKAWMLEAHYLALGLVSWVCTLSSQRIIMGGGIMQQPQLFLMIRQELPLLLNGYIQARSLMDSLDDYIVPPKLGNRAGILGALVLAEAALNRQQFRSVDPGAVPPPHKDL
jgi:fructokinase